MTDTTLNPGSPEAVQLGCTCPMDHNHGGRGVEATGTVFLMAEDCPLHWDEAADDPIQAEYRLGARENRP